MNRRQWIAGMLVIPFCLCMLFSQASGQTENQTQSQNWKMKFQNPFKKKDNSQYVDPIQLTDKPAKRKMFANPFKRDANSQTAQNIFPSQNSQMPGRDMIGSGTNQNWFQEWDRKNRDFWRNAGDNFSQFASNSNARMRERFQGFSERVKLPKMKPIEWPGFKKKDAASGGTYQGMNWRGSQQPNIKF